MPSSRARPPFRRALRLAWDSGPLLALQQGALALLQGALPVLGLWLMKLLVDAVAEGARGQDPEAVFDEVVVIELLAAGAAAAGALARNWSVFVGEKQAQAVHDHVHALLHDKAVAVDMQDLEDPQILDLLQRAQQEAPVRPQRLVGGLTQIGQGVLSLLLMAGLLMTLHWAVAAVVLVAAVPGLVVRARYARILHRWQERRAQDDRETRYFAWLLTSPAIAKEVRLFSLGSVFRRRYRQLRKLLRGERIGIARSRAWAELLVQTLGLVVTFGAYAYVAKRVITGTSTVGDFVMYAQAIQRGQAAVQAVFSGLSGLYEDGLFLDAFFRFLGLPTRVSIPEVPAPVPATPRAGFRIEGLGFTYPSGGPRVLADIDTELRVGERVAIVGPNGAGKTTLLKLLCRFYDPSVGRITLDGTDLTEFDPDALRARFACVFQDFVRYDLTVSENIRLGRSDDDVVTEAEVRVAAEAAGIHDRVLALPEGYGTRLGRRFDKGRELSIGEWQKIALARAWLRDAPILFLDEPASALDARAEEELIGSILGLARDRTALVVSHRLSTARRCDRIWVMDGGHLVEQGSHDDLVSRGGTYSDLYRAWTRHTGA
ncbi:MAG: ABC transporter ATP-binding protein [Planctomycetota bacterium]|nr:ABC transporter ATP-binding protein [Planctomycetota bacterium]